MKIKLIQVGKTDAGYLKAGVDEFCKRIRHYIGFDVITCNAPKKWSSLPVTQRKEKEGQLLLEQLKPGDVCILLDEKGTSMGSEAFAGCLEKHMHSGTRSLVFVIGGPFGFSDKVYQAAESSLSLSKMTFSHQMVRLFFVEQLYRAFAIMRGEPYHNG